MNHNLETWETARLRAERGADRHWPDLLALWSDARVMELARGARSEQQCRENFQRLQEHWEQYGFGRWVWFEKSSGRFVGMAGLRCMMVEEWPEVTLGYLLLPEYWGQGYATEIATAVAELAFGKLGMESLVAFALPHNSASRHVMEKIGMKLLRAATYENVPAVLYELTRADWSAAHPTE